MKFEEFETILKKTIDEFKNIDKFGLIGISGSLNIKKDLDLMIAPSNKIKKGEFLKELCNFLDLLKDKLKVEKSNLIAFTYSIFQEEVEYLAKRKDNDIFLHLINLNDLSSNNPKIINNLLKDCKVYIGSEENIINFKKTDMDQQYDYVFFINCLYSNYPKELETKKIHERISYTFKHLNSKLDLKNKTNKQIYFECCNLLDSKAKIL